MYDSEVTTLTIPTGQKYASIEDLIALFDQYMREMDAPQNQFVSESVKSVVIGVLYQAQNDLRKLL